MAGESSDQSVLSASDRLSGWKEIAGHVGKGVRTVQRWERSYGLPVHRLGNAGGEIIIASKREIDAWLVRQSQRPALPRDVATQAAPAGAALEEQTAFPDLQTGRSVPPDRTAPSGEGRGRLGPLTILAAAAVLVLVTGGFWFWRRLGPFDRLPAGWHVSAGAMYVTGQSGRVLWRAPIDGFLSDQTYRVPGAGLDGGFVTIADLDADGAPEVLVAAEMPNHDPRTAFYVFNADGSIRSRIQPDDHVTFGGRTYVAPWVPAHVFTGSRTGEPVHAYVAFINTEDYATLLLELDGAGRVVSRYVSNGYIQTIRPTTLKGQPALLIGGTNNETRGAALHVFYVAHASGAAPAASPKYRCEDCPRERPSELVLFPEDCISSLDEDWSATVYEFVVESNGGIGVLVGQGTQAPDGSFLATWHYVLDADLRVISIEATTGLREAHRKFQQQGLLKHDLGEEDFVNARHVLRWDTAGWVPAVVTAPATPLSRR